MPPRPGQQLHAGLRTQKHPAPPGAESSRANPPRPTTHPRIEVLCAARSSIYQAFPGLLLRTRTADAWLTRAACPVIAHPPCRFWSRSFARASATVEAMVIELLLGMFCVHQVRHRGGVLEQPAHSRLFRAAHMPTPHVSGDSSASWSIQVNQGTFGHRTTKPTWLWFARVPKALVPPPPFKLRQDACRNLDALTPGQRSATPHAFAAWLIECAGLAGPRCQ